MPTRLYTGFMLPNKDSITEDRVCYWVDVQESYEEVFAKVFPMQPPASNLEMHESFWYTKLDDGKRFACTPPQICGFEEID